MRVSATDVGLLLLTLAAVGAIRSLGTTTQAAGDSIVVDRSLLLVCFAGVLGGVNLIALGVSTNRTYAGRDAASVGILTACSAIVAGAGADDTALCFALLMLLLLSVLMLAASLAGHR